MFDQERLETLEQFSDALYQVQDTLNDIQNFADKLGYGLMAEIVGEHKSEYETYEYRINEKIRILREKIKMLHEDDA